MFNYYGSDGKQETIAPNKIYTIDGDSYFLLSGGKPYVGTRTIDKAIYSFSNAANSSDIPGKMVRNAWVGENTKKGVSEAVISVLWDVTRKKESELTKF